jgi:hypothetical protein
MCWIHELSVDIWICKGQVYVPSINKWVHGHVRLSMYLWVYRGHRWVLVLYVVLVNVYIYGHVYVHIQKI